MRLNGDLFANKQNEIWMKWLDDVFKNGIKYSKNFPQTNEMRRLHEITNVNLQSENSQQQQFLRKRSTPSSK